MSTIAWFEKQIAAISKFAAEDEVRLLLTPDDFALQIIVSNNRQHLDSLRHDLMLAQAERENEVFGLRLISPTLERGAIPLRLLARISGPLHKFIAGTAYHLWHGKDPSRGIPSHWSNELDLRLAGVGHGSTRLYLTGNVKPDLAGDSALQGGLDAIFSLLNAQPEEFFDALHTMGPVAAKGLTEFLKTMEAEGINTEFSWMAPDNCLHKWNGNYQEIVRLRSVLDEANSTFERSFETIYGTVSLLSSTGRIEILQDDSNAKVKIKFPKGNKDWLAGITLHQRVEAVVEKTTWPDPVSDERHRRYILVEPIVSSNSQGGRSDTPDT